MRLLSFSPVYAPRCELLTFRESTLLSFLEYCECRFIAGGITTPLRFEEYDAWDLNDTCFLYGLSFAVVWLRLSLRMFYSNLTASVWILTEPTSSSLSLPISSRAAWLCFSPVVSILVGLGTFCLDHIFLVWPLLRLLASLPSVSKFVYSTFGVAGGRLPSLRSLPTAEGWEFFSEVFTLLILKDDDVLKSWLLGFFEGCLFKFK